MRLHPNGIRSEISGLMQDGSHVKKKVTSVDMGGQSPSDEKKLFSCQAFCCANSNLMWTLSGGEFGWGSTSVK